MNGLLEVRPKHWGGEQKDEFKDYNDLERLRLRGEALSFIEHAVFVRNRSGVEAGLKMLDDKLEVWNSSHWYPHWRY